MCQVDDYFNPRVEDVLERERRNPEAFDALLPEQRLATILHGIFCVKSHRAHRKKRECNWYKEYWDNPRPGGSRDTYLQKAKRLIEVAGGNVVKATATIHVIA